MATTAERIQNLRKELNISQLELAETLKVSEETISNWERGVRKPTGERLELLARFFHVTKDYILCQSDIRLFDGKMNSPTMSDRDELIEMIGRTTRTLSNESLVELFLTATCLKRGDEAEERYIISRTR